MTELIPVRPVVHYMMGGVHTDIDGATPLAGPLRRRRDRLRQHQRRQPARLQLAARVPGLRRPRRPGGRRVRRDRRRRRRRRRSRAQVADEVRRLERACMGATPRDDAVAADPRRRCRRRWRRPPGIYRTGPAHGQGRRRAPRAAGAGDPRSGSGTPAGPSTPSCVAALELANMLDVAECILASGLQREESRGAHQRTDFPDARRRAVPRPPPGPPRATTAPRGSKQLPVTITRWPPGRAGLREVTHGDDEHHACR